MKKKLRLSVAASFCALAALVSAGIVFAISNSHSRQSARTTAAARQSSAHYISDLTKARGAHPTRPSRALVAHYAILRRARAASEQLPGSYVPPLITQNHLGLDVGDSQQITLPDGSAAWFVPGSSGACLLYSPGGVCGDTEIAVQGLLGVKGGATQTLVGTVPDGASVSVTTSDGSTLTVPVANNAFSVSTPSTNRFTSVRTRFSSGTESTVNLPPGVS